MDDEVKDMIDIAAGGTALFSMAAWLPPTASLFTIAWLGLRIFESDTVQKLLKRDKSK